MVVSGGNGGDGGEGRDTHTRTHARTHTHILLPFLYKTLKSTALLTPSTRVSLRLIRLDMLSRDC